jgi:hypothetical protein
MAWTFTESSTGMSSIRPVVPAAPRVLVSQVKIANVSYLGLNKTLANLRCTTTSLGIEIGFGLLDTSKRIFSQCMEVVEQVGD